MTNDLFTPPERRPAPARLRERIIDEIEAEEASTKRPNRRWLAPLVAASMVVAIGGGALALRDEGATPQPAHTPPSSTSMPSSDPEFTPDPPLTGGRWPATAGSSTW